MKIAYLIAAHSDPKHLSRLIKALHISNVTDFYIHIDKKSDMSLFTSILGGGSNIKFTKSRIYTQWAGYSQCKYQKVLIDECLASEIEYDRIFFLSGLDYPLWSNDRIIKFIENNPDKELMCGMNLSLPSVPRRLKWKIIYYHPFRNLHIRNQIIWKALNKIGRIAMRGLGFRKKSYIRQGSQKMNIYMGSSWWGVTYDCLKEIQNGMDDPRIIKYFRMSYACDEMLPQTIVFNSKFAKSAILYEGHYPGLVGLTPLHYIEYGSEIKIFTSDDYDNLTNSDKMFFRKAITGKSDSLLDRIDCTRQNFS